ncbi:Peptidase family M48 [Desulfatibacillum alkenivorans DSM 16219]|jgi:predicted Zn-dependent protease|uniref:Peptidase family M48 n=1 Tax=Desulfatibacillum alkenivorans DSM 16219 TaxID=1121393 RepID=A0A1M6U0R3_9BACT|nr:M48 family metallopeptidase [Desulfatibacillum alkenivorans]SHK62743.1 Peptidase family M48 [Desulfatibacillum alkenivorans DSM 16219]
MPALKKSVIYFLLLCLSLALAACSTVPITGRSQLSLVSPAQMQSMSYSQYDAFLKEHKVSTDRQKTEMVQRVGYRIQRAVERYFAAANMSSQLNGFQWEFNLIADDQVNAWAMPGGKVVVYEGILDVAQNETGLAVVMGHEIAHVVANHGAERMSQSLMAQMGGMALDLALHDRPAQTRALWLQAYGLGSQVGVILPYSRLHESEADRLGLIFMAMAGYDPAQAVGFWQRMSASSKNSNNLEFLSTHPSDATRIAKIKQILPEARRYYKK